MDVSRVLSQTEGLIAMAGTSGKMIRCAAFFILAFFTAPALVPQSLREWDYIGERFYEIPEDRLPLRLSLSVTHDTNPDDDIISTMQLSLLESDSDEAVQGVIYLFEFYLDKDQGESSADNGDPQRSDIVQSFFAPNGTLTLVIAEGDVRAGREVENGALETEYGAWYASDPMAAPLTLMSPLISENSTYSLLVYVLTIDGVKNHIDVEEAPWAQFTINNSENLSSSVSVVPEFPIGPFLLFGLMFVSIVVYSRMSLLWKQPLN